MKITVSKSIFESVLNNCQNFLDKKYQHQSASHIYFEAKENDTLIIKATDLEMWIEATIPIKCEVPGYSNCNGKNILQWIKGLKDNDINIESDEDTIIIKQGKSKTKMQMFNTDEIPEFPKYETDKKINIESQKFLQSIKKINPAIDTNNPKYELNGSYLDIKEYGFNFVATDTRRLALIKHESQSIQTCNLIIPKRAISEIQKLFIDNIEIYYNKTHLIIKTDEYTFYTKLINGKFPDYEKIIPKEFKYTTTLPKDEFMNKIRLISSLSNSVKISFSKNEILFEALSEENTEASDQIEIQTNIDEFVFGLNSKYILDFLSQIDSDEFTISMNETNTPFVVSSGNFHTVIMPVTL